MYQDFGTGPLRIVFWDTVEWNSNLSSDMGGTAVNRCREEDSLAELKLEAELLWLFDRLIFAEGKQRSLQACSISERTFS